MGYLSQKKHRIRENIFFCVMAIILLLLTIGLFINPGFQYGFFNLFHFYCLSAGLFIYALWVKKYKESLLFAAVLLICYTVLSANGNIFLSNRFSGSENLKLTFAPNLSLSEEFAADKKAAGSLVIARRHKASYVVIDKNASLTLVKVDFRNAATWEYPQIFEHLREFILTQDNPVIIFGEFGLPSWSRPFKKFLNQSGLRVHNRLLFTAGGRFNIFSVPGFYVLGFSEMGISDIRIDDRPAGKSITTTVSFNPARR